ncbi:hypothetical protein ACOMHN_054112 [Nucella lapillus]
MFDGPNPSIWKFIAGIQKEQSLQHGVKIEMEGGHPGPTSKKHFSAINKRLQTLIQSCERDEDNEDEDDDENDKVPFLRRRILALLRQKFLWLMCFNQMMVTAGYATGYNFFPAYADSLGVPSEDVPALYTVYGVMVILSRLVGGVVFNVFPNHLLVAFCCVQLGMALSFGLLPFYGVSTQTLFVERCITGVTFGPSLLLVAPILVHYLGTKNLSLALGAVLLCSGIGAVSAPAIAEL